MPLILWIAIGIAVPVIGIDIYLARKYGFQGTISWWVWTNSVQYPIIPAAICLVTGIFIGHYFWNIEALILIPVGVLIGHWFWDQELNITVKGGDTE